MKKRRNPYKRCKVCKELVIDVDNCAVCENKDPNASPGRQPGHGKRGVVTLDMQEGNHD